MAIEPVWPRLTLVNGVGWFDGVAWFDGVVRCSLTPLSRLHHYPSYTMTYVNVSRGVMSVMA